MNKLNWPKQLQVSSTFLKGLDELFQIIVENNVEVKIHKWEPKHFFTSWNYYDVECKNRDNPEDYYAFVLGGEDQMNYFKMKLRKVRLKELTNES